MTNKDRALNAIRENPGRFNGLELADHLHLGKNSWSMKLLELDREGHIVIKDGKWYPTELVSSEG